MKKFFAGLIRQLSARRAARLEAAVAASLLLCALLTVFSAVAEQRSIASKLVRLHISAASDSAGDQADKLAVRDRLTAELAGELETLSTPDEAVLYLESRLDTIEELARGELQKRGTDCAVTAMIAVEYFPERVYEGISLPAGEYTSLRLSIGGGGGANWWCVMFPPLCTSAAVKEDGRAYDFSRGEWRTISEKSPKIKVKFKILEVFSTVKRWFE